MSEVVPDGKPIYLRGVEPNPAGIQPDGQRGRVIIMSMERSKARRLRREQSHNVCMHSFLEDETHLGEPTGYFVCAICGGQFKNQREAEENFRRRIRKHPTGVDYGGPEHEKWADPPFCPKCRSRMVLRRSSSGFSAGEWFWACPEFPKCNGTRKYERSR